jgi:hypothetical protein
MYWRRVLEQTLQGKNCDEKIRVDRFNGAFQTLVFYIKKRLNVKDIALHLIYHEGNNTPNLLRFR